MDNTALRVHKIRLSPNNKQRGHLQKCAGIARFAYNWALAQWQTQYQEYKNGNRSIPPTHRSIRNHLTSIKRDEFPWMMEVSKCVPQESIAQLGTAYKNFFERKANYPQFKKRGRSKDSFKITGDHIKAEGKYLRLAKVPGHIIMTEKPRFEGRIVSATFSRTADHWYVSLLIEATKPEQLSRPVNQRPREVIGVDLGVHEHVASSGTRYRVPRTYRASQRKLRRVQQSLSRKQLGSKNRQKARMSVSKVHARITCIRQDWLHKTSAEIVHDNRVVVLEDLNVVGMLKFSSGLSKSVLDAGFGEFRRQVVYKVDQSFGRGYVIADRYYPSSKLCSQCKTKTKSLLLGAREWVCESCGALLDRDLNASVNLEKYYAGGSSVTVCGRLYASASSDRMVDGVSVPGEAETSHRLLLSTNV